MQKAKMMARRPGFGGPAGASVADPRGGDTYMTVNKMKRLAMWLQSEALGQLLPTEARMEMPPLKCNHHRKHRNAGHVVAIACWSCACAVAFCSRRARRLRAGGAGASLRRDGARHRRAEKSVVLCRYHLARRRAQKFRRPSEAGEAWAEEISWPKSRFHRVSTRCSCWRFSEKRAEHCPKESARAARYRLIT